LRGSTIVKCAYCGKENRYSNSRIKRSKNLFCSKECYDKFQCGENHSKFVKKIIYKCSNCGNDIEKYPKNKSKTGRYFCNSKCRIEFSKGEFAPYYKDAKKEYMCENCGVTFVRDRCHIKENSFCSPKCSSEYHKGENNPRWKGGIAYEPYCEKFNKEFKERVRAFFNYKCVLCGKTTEENGINMSVHHVHYDKSSCCSDAPKMFVTLCKCCHTKTNHNQKFWESKFETMINEEYNGKCYLKKEEYYT